MTLPRCIVSNVADTSSTEEVTVCKLKMRNKSKNKIPEIPGLEFHSCRGKAILSKERALPLEYQNVFGNILTGTKAKTTANSRSEMLHSNLKVCPFQDQGIAQLL